VFLQNSFSYDIPEAKPGTVRGYLSRYIGLEVFFVLSRAQKRRTFCIPNQPLTEWLLECLMRDTSDNIMDSSFTYSDVEVLRPGEKTIFLLL
jgi:hypothetical protein